MRVLGLLTLLSLSACSSLQIELIRNPASVGNCNRQALGVNSSENRILMDFNSKRREAVVKLVQAQIDRLQSRVTDGSVQVRLNNLRIKLATINEPAMKAWDEPVEVSYKLRRVMEVYLEDVAIDEKANALSDKDLQNVKYARESIQPNLGQLDYWIPDFCKSTSGTTSPDIFKGI